MILRPIEDEFCWGEGLGRFPECRESVNGQMPSILFGTLVLGSA